MATKQVTESDSDVNPPHKDGQRW